MGGRVECRRDAGVDWAPKAMRVQGGQICMIQMPKEEDQTI